MSSIKCSNCGLVNFGYLENCKRCRTVLNYGESGPSAPNPQRQVVGAWRDRCWLVKKVNVPLKDRCIKCSESANVSYQPVSVKAYSAWSLLTQLVGVRVFRMIDLEIPLCRRHQFGMDKLVVGMILAGVVISALGFALLQTYSILPIALFLAGFVVIGAGIIAHLVRRDIVKVWRFKEPYVWLWGVHRSYLEGLPNWSERQAR
ncbi:MAG TPA: hypothetical protein VN643_07300 [Pyrinomonadaceae bacterium]|nr:hypothetical protein [Pyrinomonadaceae bacterium]